MHINMAKMSQEELQFIKLYCVLLRRQHDSIRTVMSLMQPDDGLAISSPVQAARLAEGLHDIAEEFDVKMTLVRAKHGIKEKIYPRDEIKFMNELADIFALSFFKIVAVSDETTSKINFVKDGWCSGEPESWSKQLEDQNFVNAKSSSNDVMSYIANFFSMITSWKHPSINQKSAESDEEREEYEDDDEWYEHD